MVSLRTDSMQILASKLFQARPAWSVHAGLATPFAINFHKVGSALTAATAPKQGASWRGKSRFAFRSALQSQAVKDKQDSWHPSFAKWTKSIAEFRVKHDRVPGGKSHSQLACYLQHVLVAVYKYLVSGTRGLITQAFGIHSFRQARAAVGQQT